MQQKPILIFLLLCIFLSCSEAQANDLWKFGSFDLAKTVTQLFKGGEAPRKHKKHYKTWTVSEVTADKIILQRKLGDGKTETTSIDLSRRSYLKVGDRVRYDKIRNRLGRTLDKQQK